MARYRGRHSAQPTRARRYAKGAGVTGLVMVLVLSTVFVVVYRQLQGNINRVPFDDSEPRPDTVEVAGPQQPLNILVMGTDSREGENASIGGDSPGLSDTTILLHLSANREFAYGVSLPRDAMVQQPECRRKSGEGRDLGGLRMFNAAFAIGGPACTVKMVEQLTNIRINHFVVVDFVGFKKMVDAINGVTICLPYEVNDMIGHINLPAGTFKANGRQALDYFRVRHGIGANTGDIGRMKRQQAFIAAMIDRVVSAGTLANPVRLYNFLEAATESLTTDDGLANLRVMASLGMSLKDIGMDKVKFITVPWQGYAPDRNRVEWAPEADELWRRIRNDRPLGAKLSTEAVTPAEEAERGRPGKGTGPGAGEPGTTPPTTPGTQTPSPGAEDERARLAREAGLCA